MKLNQTSFYTCCLCLVGSKKNIKLLDLQYGANMVFCSRFMQKTKVILLYICLLFLYSNAFAGKLNDQYSKSVWYDSAWYFTEKCNDFAYVNDTANAEMYLKKLSDFTLKT